MGGKTKTYTSLSSGRVFDQEDCLFNLDMMRNYALTKSIEPMQFMRSMLDSMHKYYSIKYLEAMGIEGYSRAIVEKIALSDITRYIKQHCGHHTEKILPFWFSSEDEGGNTTYFTNTSIAQYLNRNYVVDKDYASVVVDTYHFKADSKIKCKTYLGEEITALDMHMRMFHVSRHTYEKAENVYRYRVYQNAKTAYTIKKPMQVRYSEDIDTHQVLMDIWTLNDDDEWEQTEETEWLSVPFKEKLTYIVKYYWDNTNTCDKDTWGIMEIPKDKIITANDVQYFMILPIKQDFNFVEYEKYQKVLLTSYGFKAEDFKEQLKQEEIKHAFLTFSNKFIYGKEKDDKVNPIVLDWMQKIYGQCTKWHLDNESGLMYCVEIQNGVGSSPEITIENDYYNIAYKVKRSLTGNFEAQYVIEIDEFSFRLEAGGDGDGLFLIPLGSLKKVPIRQKYEILKQSFAVWGNMEKVVHLSWYQTAFFRFISFILGYISALVFGGLAMAFKYVVGFMANTVFKQVFGAYGGIIASLFMLGLNGFSWSVSNIVTNISNHLFSFLLNFGKQFFGVRFQLGIQGIKDEIEEYQDDTDDITKELLRIQKQRIFIPLSDYNTFYDSMYQNAFAVYDDKAYSPLDALNQQYMNPFDKGF